MRVILCLALFLATSHGFPAENSEDLCHASTCGLGATCSQVSTLIVCKCMDGYEGDAFKECIPASTTAASQPSSSLPATTTSQTTTRTTTVPSTTAEMTTASTTTTTTVPLTQVQSVERGTANLPCDISIPDSSDPSMQDDDVILVLWYREDMGRPIYSVDARDRSFQEAEIWQDENVFNNRAYFRLSSRPAILAIENVGVQDRGVYRCRVDFRLAQTRNEKVNLTVIGTPVPVAPVSQTMFNIPVRTQSYNEVVKTIENRPHPVLVPVPVTVPVQKHENRRQQSPVIDNDDLMNQYPSAPPTLSHYAPTFQQKLQAQPIQFGGGHSHSEAGQSFQQDRYQPALFDGTKTRERPQPPSPPHSSQSQLGPINGHDANEQFYYHDNVQQPPNSKFNHQSSSNSQSQTSEFGSGSGSSFNLPSHSHNSQFHTQHGSQSHKGDMGSIVPAPAPMEDHRRRPILGNGNANDYPISSSNGGINVASEDDQLDDDEMRDATFIKDPLGKYDKCHTVNNIVVCAENSNAETVKQDKYHRPSSTATQKPLETRRIDSRPPSNANNQGMGAPRIPMFPSSGSHRPHTQHYHQTDQQTTYYPINISYTENTNPQQNYLQSQFSHRHHHRPGAAPVPDFTSPSSIRPQDPSADAMCQRFCGEGAVCRIILERPVCGCSEGHTGDPTVKCSPILNSKYDTKSCQRHTDCPATEVCHQSRCADPCDESTRTSRSNRCGRNASCRVIEHTQLCSCKEGFNGNPYMSCT